MPGRGRYEAGAIAVAVFVSGAALLGIEIAASRVLSPFFGNSLYVWGALIGVVLTGLAIGYWAGGVLADRFPALGLLLGVIGLGSLAVLAIPLVDEPILEAIVRWDPGPRADPVAAAIALFGAPSILFAMVAPVAVRLRIQTIATAGTTAGRLFAVSTAGSIVGTFATAFWLIPSLGTTKLLGLIAAVCFAAVALVAGSLRRVVPAGLALVAAAGALAAANALSPPSSGGRLSGAEAQNWSPVYRLRGEDAGPRASQEGFRVRFTEDTRYHRLAVVDDRDSRFLRFDSSFQSGMFLGRPYATRFGYTDYFELGFAYRPEARTVLFLGLGGGSAPKRIWRDFPGTQSQVVELDPVVAQVARRWFALPESPRLRVSVSDARAWLDRHDERFDLVAVDTFFSDGIPFHLTTREFVERLHSRLTPGGVVLVNVIGALTGDDSKLLRSLYRTYREVFPTVTFHPVWSRSGRDATQVRNVILVAMDGPLPQQAFLQQRWRALRRAHPQSANLTAAIAGRWEEPVPVDDVPTLTDDYAPTDALLLD
jgi:spermidine synthase